MGNVRRTVLPSTCTSDIRHKKTNIMKSIFLILAIVIVANSANIEERDEERCNVSQGCQDEVEMYKVCQERTSLARGLKQETGPCITCPDESKCCCAATPDKGSGRSSDGICGISKACQKEIEDGDCQGQDRKDHMMADSSLGCEDGSRCWCFLTDDD